MSEENDFLVNRLIILLIVIFALISPGLEVFFLSSLSISHSPPVKGIASCIVTVSVSDIECMGGGGDIIPH